MAQHVVIMATGSYIRVLMSTKKRVVLNTVVGDGHVIPSIPRAKGPLKTTTEKCVSEVMVIRPLCIAVCTLCMGDECIRIMRKYPSLSLYIHICTM